MKIGWIVFVISVFFVKSIRQMELEENTVEPVSQTVKPELTTVKTLEKVETVENVKTVEKVETESKTAKTESQTVKSDSIGPIQILEPNGTSFQYVENNQLERILSSDDLKDHYIVVISAVGRFQTGKSFLLNVFLEYLRSKYATSSTNSAPSNSSNWLSTKIENRFDSKHNNKGHTKGMWAWPEIFTHNCENGDKLAFLLLDTEGMHEKNDSLMVRDRTIFTLSTLTSSMQFYNFHKHVTNVDSQIFRLFTAYAELVSNMSSKNGEHVEKPFQQSNIIIRDYRRDGNDENDEELTKELSDLPIINETQPYYNETFQVYTLPQPETEFDGVISNAKKDFVEKIKKIVPKLLSPDKLRVKNIFGQKIKAKDILTYFKEYTMIFTNGSLPKPTTILNATASVLNHPIYKNSLDFYESLMQGKLDEKTSYYKVDAFQEIHSESLNKSVDKFDKTLKIGGEEYTAPLRKKLLEGIAEKFIYFNNTNEQKHQMYLRRAESAYETLSKTIKDEFAERLYEILNQTEPNQIDTSLVASKIEPLMTKASEKFNASEYNDDEEVSAAPQEGFRVYFSNLLFNLTQALKLYKRSTSMYVSLMNSEIEGGKYYNENELKQKHQNALSVLRSENGTNVFSDVGCDVRNRKEMFHLLKCDKIDDFIENEFKKFKEKNTALKLQSSLSPPKLAYIMGIGVIIISAIIVAIAFYYLYLCCCDQKPNPPIEPIISVEENRSRSNSLVSNKLIANSRSNSFVSNTLIVNSRSNSLTSHSLVVNSRSNSLVSNPLIANSIND